MMQHRVAGLWQFGLLESHNNSILFACIISSPILLLIVLAPRSVGNTDGIDPDSSENVIIDSCYIDVGDDGISIKVRKHKKRNHEWGKIDTTVRYCIDLQDHDNDSKIRYTTKNTSPTKKPIKYQYIWWIFWSNFQTSWNNTWFVSFLSPWIFWN